MGDAPEPHGQAGAEVCAPTLVNGPLRPLVTASAVAQESLVVLKVRPPGSGSACWLHAKMSSWECGVPHAIWVNRRGERFCDETQSPEREIAIAGQPGKIAYILLDQRLVERIDDDASGGELLAEGAVGQDHARPRYRPDTDPVRTGISDSRYHRRSSRM